MERGRDDYLLGMNAQNFFFFSVAETNKYCLGVELAPAYRVIKKVQNRSSVGLHAVSHSMPQQLHNVIKNKKGMPRERNSE